MSQIQPRPAARDGTLAGDAAVPPGMPPRRIEALPADRVEPETVEWLWPPRFAAGTLGLILGDPDNGKSLLTLDMAARLSRGLAWPDGGACAPGQVLIVSSEDGLATTVRPRLEAAGADLSRVHLFAATLLKEGGNAETAGFSLKSDAAALDDWLAKTAGVRLVILDPLGAFTAGANAASENEVRALLRPFAVLAERRRVAMLGVVHTNKSPGAKALYRMAGSLAFVAAARHVYALGRDRCDPTRRILARVKNNLSSDPSGLAFAITDGPAGQPVIVWEPEPVEADAAGVLDGTETKLGKLAEAEAWLGSLLAREPEDVENIRWLSGKDDFSWRTIERAKQNLGVVAKRVDFSYGNKWCWVLPKKPRANP